MADQIIQLRKGLKQDLPAEAGLGEPLFASDTSEMFVGLGTGLAPEAIVAEIVDDSVTTLKLATGAVTSDKLAAGVAGDGLVLGTGLELNPDGTTIEVGGSVLVPKFTLTGTTFHSPMEAQRQNNQSSLYDPAYVQYSAISFIKPTGDDSEWDNLPSIDAKSTDGTLLSDYKTRADSLPDMTGKVYTLDVSNLPEGITDLDGVGTYVAVKIIDSENMVTIITFYEVELYNGSWRLTTTDAPSAFYEDFVGTVIVKVPGIGNNVKVVSSSVTATQLSETSIELDKFTDLETDLAVSAGAGKLANADTIVSYVELVAQGYKGKIGAVCATTAPLASLAGLLQIDGVTLTDGEYVLVKNQATAKYNGVYIAHAGAWERAPEFDGTPSNEVHEGVLVYVQSGTLNGDAGFIVTDSGNVNVGTDPIDFMQVSKGGQVIAGAGLSKLANAISVKTDNSTVVVVSDVVQVADHGITANELKNLSVTADKIAANVGGAGLEATTGVVNVVAGDGVEITVGTVLDNILGTYDMGSALGIDLPGDFSSRYATGQLVTLSGYTTTSVLPLNGLTLPLLTVHFNHMMNRTTVTFEYPVTWTNRATVQNQGFAHTGALVADNTVAVKLDGTTLANSSDGLKVSNATIQTITDIDAPTTGSLAVEIAAREADEVTLNDAKDIVIAGLEAEVGATPTTGNRYLADKALSDRLDTLESGTVDAESIQDIFGSALSNVGTSVTLNYGDANNQFSADANVDDSSISADVTTKQLYVNNINGGTFIRAHITKGI